MACFPSFHFLLSTCISLTSQHVRQGLESKMYFLRLGWAHPCDFWVSLNGPMSFPVDQVATSKRESISSIYWMVKYTRGFCIPPSFIGQIFLVDFAWRVIRVNTNFQKAKTGLKGGLGQVSLQVLCDGRL